MAVVASVCVVAAGGCRKSVRCHGGGSHLHNHRVKSSAATSTCITNCVALVVSIHFKLLGRGGCTILWKGFSLFEVRFNNMVHLSHRF